MGRHSAPDEKPDPRSRTAKDRRPGPKHAGDPPKRAPRKAAAAKATPTSSAPVTSPRRVSVPPARARSSGERQREMRHEAQMYANRAAMRANGGKPSVTGRTAAGAAAGAAAGTAIAPGVGTAVGAVVGGGAGAVGGARAKKAYKIAMRTNGAARRIIVAEFAICIVVGALAPLTDRKRDEPPGAFMKRMTAIMAVFLILGLISSMGRTAGKLAAGVGGLIAVALAVAERDLFTKVGGIFASTANAPDRGTGPLGDGAGGTLGSEAGKGAGAGARKAGG